MYNNKNNKVYFKSILKIFYLCKTMLLIKFNRILKIKIIKQNNLLKKLFIKNNKIIKQIKNKIT